MSMIIDSVGRISFEEALDKTGFGAYNICIACLSGVVIICFACIFYGSTMVVPISACDLGTSGAQQGILVAGPIVGAILGACVWGYIADRYGRKNTLITSLLAGAFVNLASSLSDTWVMMLILQFIAALMISGQFSLAMTLLSESVPAAQRNLLVMMVTSIFLLSNGLMAVLAMPIIPLTFNYHIPYLEISWNSWRTLLVLYSLPSLLTAGWLHCMQESPKFVYTKGDEKKALQILAVIYRWNHRNSGHHFQVKGLLRRTGSSLDVRAGGGSRFLQLFRRPLLKYTIIMTLLFLLEQLAAFKVWLPTVAHRFVQVVQSGEGGALSLCGCIASSLRGGDDLEMESTSAATCALDFEALLIVLVVTVMMSVTNIFVSLAAIRFGRRNTVMVLTSVTGASGVLVNLVPHAITSAALFGVQLMGIVALGLYTALAVSLFPTYLRALAITLTTTGSRIANFGSIQIINYLLVHNCELAFYIYGTLLALSAVVAYFLPKDSLRSNSQYEIL